MHGVHQREGSDLMTKLMIKEIGFFNADQNPPGVWTLDAAQSGEGWKSLPPNGFYNEQILDLAGLSQEQKTVFFNGIAQQELGNPVVLGGAAGDGLHVIDVISSIPLSETSITAMLTYGNFSSGLGIPVPTFEQTIYMNVRDFVVDVDTAAWGYMVLVSSNQLGSLQPTASDRLYCYRAMYFNQNFTGTASGLNSVRYVIGANPEEEKEYQYLMRLKKSYDLQQSFDVDGNRPH